ncbi:phage tail assembly protein T [Providencia stuartii]|nr:Uncharacterised protein [Acinetobacter baumannii]
MMTLALRLGKTLDELASSMSMSELQMWLEYDAISPIGDHRSDIHAALISSVVLNSQGVKATVADMLPIWSSDEQVEASNDDVSSFESFLSNLAQ